MVGLVFSILDRVKNGKKINLRAKMQPKQNGLSNAAASRSLRRNVVMARHVDDASAIVSLPCDPVIQPGPAQTTRTGSERASLLDLVILKTPTETKTPLPSKSEIDDERCYLHSAIAPSPPRSHDHNEVRVERAILLNHIVLGCRFVCSAVNKAGLAKLIGLAVETNVGRVLNSKLFHHPLVLSTGSGVNGFTLDPSLGEFILTHPDIKEGRLLLAGNGY
uniref:Uncharacterized protein n=1 Tax=Salix viminalis TaxID=40686 RepID=A0A6N2KN26_SALVM